jgi:hypothetical protein
MTHTFRGRRPIIHDLARSELASRSPVHAPCLELRFGLQALGPHTLLLATTTETFVRLQNPELRRGGGGFGFGGGKWRKGTKYPNNGAGEVKPFLESEGLGGNP